MDMRLDMTPVLYKKRGAGVLEETTLQWGVSKEGFHLWVDGEPEAMKGRVAMIEKLEREYDSKVAHEFRKWCILEPEISA